MADLVTTMALNSCTVVTRDLESLKYLLTGSSQEKGAICKTKTILNKHLPFLHHSLAA